MIAPTWFCVCRAVEVLNVLPKGGTIELFIHAALCSYNFGYGFWLLRYITVTEDGSLVVCERSLTNTQNSPSIPAVPNFVQAEMVSSGYLIRPCEGGGSIIHIVDHMNLEAWSVPEVLFPLYESSTVLAQKMTMTVLRQLRQIAQEVSQASTAD